VDLTHSEADEQFRQEFRAWLDENLPAEWRTEEFWATKTSDEAFDLRREWERNKALAGWAGIQWPKEYGGRGGTPTQKAIYDEELARARAPLTVNTLGLTFLGPTVMAIGTEEQKKEIIPALLRNDVIWCQGFSEPGAGSDLAALTTRAEVQGDEYILNGQKVWTTNAQFAAYGLLLARTDAEVPKHKGLTMFIVPMDAQGVTIRGLRQISGEAEFNEVFFDDVKLPADAVCGEVNGGWGTALTTLMFERVTIGLGSEGMGYRSDRFAHAIGADPDARVDGEVRHALGEIGTELLAIKFSGYRTLTALQRGQIPGPEAGLAKVTLVNAAIRAGELIADVLGPEVLEEPGEWSYMISFLPGLKSAGGTEEILRNTIGERVLGLPPEPRLDKGIPFSELRAKEREAVAP
jgi:alkylation response protein AidB-like acyl-CoA dehydrogenase